MTGLRFAVIAVAVTSLVCVFGTLAGWSYTQSGVGLGFANGVPMGHEWVTRMAAIELLGYTPVSPPDNPDPKDPRKAPNWQPRAKNTNLSGAQAEVQRIRVQSYNDQRYASRYKPVYDAIVGERWVDIAGYNVVAGKLPWAYNCWDAVAQEPAEIQNDHFMRRYDDADGVGGVTAAYSSQVRFIKYFVAAAMAPPSIMQAYDGGAADSTAVDVDRNYFLFGRAVHLFEDSFSSEHTVRIPADYTRVRQVKSYLCAKGSEQHSHSMGAVLDYSSGDVIWLPGTGLDPSWNAYKASNMKYGALAATEGTKDLWAAFIRTMATPVEQRQATALAEATTLVNNWLGYDENEMKTWYNDEAHRDATYVLAQGQTGNGRTQQQCMANLGVGTDDQLTYVRELEATQRQCLYNAVPWRGYEDLVDTSMRTWFSWQWRNKIVYETPPADWQIPNLPADSGVRVRIKSVANGQYMSAPDGVVSDAWVYCKPGTKPLDFILVGSKDDGVLRVANAPDLFLSYKLDVIPRLNGAVKLYAPSPLDPTNYKISNLPGFQGPQWSIMSSSWGQYMWLYDQTQSPYITRTGDPANANARWYFEPLGGGDAGAKCCWDRLVQGCLLDSGCDPTGEGCIYSGMSTKRYGAVQCNVAKCCWDRLIQSCKQNSDCDPGGEGCVTSGTNTFAYGRFQCSTCEMQGMVYDPVTSKCKPKIQ